VWLWVGGLVGGCRGGWGGGEEGGGGGWEGGGVGTTEFRRKTRIGHRQDGSFDLVGFPGEGIAPKDKNPALNDRLLSKRVTCVVS